MFANSSEFSWCKMSEIKRQNAKRCLFGVPDREKQNEDLRRQDKILTEPEIKRFSERWSFDPVTGPLSTGPLQWVSVDPLSEIPSYYKKGYSASYKSEPACLVRDSICLAQCYIGVRSRPISAKRKLDLDDKDDENVHTSSENLENVGKKCLLRQGSGSQCESVPATVTAHDVADKICSGVYHSSLGLRLSSTVPTFTGLSPVSRVKEVITPPQVVQSSLKDFLPTKKQRLNIKTLPRT